MLLPFGVSVGSDAGVDVSSSLRAVRSMTGLLWVQDDNVPSELGNLECRCRVSLMKVFGRGLFTFERCAVQRDPVRPPIRVRGCGVDGRHDGKANVRLSRFLCPRE